MISMHVVNEDKSIYVTRGDAVRLAFSADNHGVPYVFQPGEIVRFKVFEKKGCHCVVLQKDFVLTEAVESVDVWLTKEETKIGDVISKPKDYWYEVELNPDSNPQTIVGYDDDGAKIFRLFPEGADTSEGADGELVDFVPGIDDELDAESERPVQNKAIAGAISAIEVRVEKIEKHGGGGGSVAVDDHLSATSENPVQNKVITNQLNDMLDDMQDACVDVWDNTHDTFGDAVRHQVDKLGKGISRIETDLEDLKNSSITVDGDLSATSENPVQNRVVTEKFNEMTEWHNGMANIVNEHTKAISKLEENGGGNIVVDDKLDPISANPVENRVIVSALSDMNGTVADAKSIANTANNTASNAQTAANSAINKAKEANDKADALAERVTFLEDVDVVTSVNGMDGAVQLTASDVGARPNTWMPSHTDVGADRAGTANTTVATHNTKDDAHNDIRLLITTLTKRLDALANSDDETLDQMAEVVAYIKANRDLIEQVTTGKVSVADIVNNLTTNVTDKPLSAAQGVALKALIDAITVPTKLSELAADATHRLVTDTEKAAWNAKSNFSGAYADLTGKPTIPTVPTKVSAFTNDAGYLTDYEETDPTVPSWAKAASKPSYTKSEVGLGNVDNVKQYSASNQPPYPVTSVNGKTGAVTVSVPTKTSQLTNDSGFLTSHQDISGKADKSSAETWTFTLEDGSTVTKKVVLA